MSEPELSVIVPTYKRTDSLERLLNCLFDQHGIQLEIVVVDQNQPGFFSETLLELLKDAKHVRQEIPNASMARNLGYKNASARHILFIDDDLVPAADFCRHGMDIFKSHPEIDCFVPLVYSELGKEKAEKWALEKKTSKDPEKDVFTISDTISAVIFFKSEVYAKTGGFDPYLFEFARTAEDQEFFLRMQFKGLKLWFVREIEIFHDEGLAGGCDLRTDTYWNTRFRCIKAWSFRYRIHNTQTPGRLSQGDRFKLYRSAFLNGEVLRSGIGSISKQINLTAKAIRQSRDEFDSHKNIYGDIMHLSHLEKLS